VIGSRFFIEVLLYEEVSPHLSKEGIKGGITEECSPARGSSSRTNHYVPPYDVAKQAFLRRFTCPVMAFDGFVAMRPGSRFSVADELRKFLAAAD
jgi:hypothetical protein